jgi:hypothetical protein
MKLRNCIFAALLAAVSLSAASAPAGGQTTAPDLAGTWEADTPDGPQTIVVRADSSASFGEDIIRWRAVPDTVYLALGGEWIAYNFVLRGSTLTLSGGDLEEPIELRRVGPPTPRPEGVPVPPVPDTLPPGSIGR